MRAAFFLSYIVLFLSLEMLHHLERRYKDDYMNVSLVPDEILQIGDLAIERGTWMLRSSDGIVTASGKYVQDNSALIHNIVIPKLK